MDNSKIYDQWGLTLAQKGIDSSFLEDDLYSFDQKFALYRSARLGHRLYGIDNPDIPASEMEDIIDEQLDLIKKTRAELGIDPSKYNFDQMYELNEALVKDLDVTPYKSHEFSAEHMHIAKTFQLEGLPGIEQISHDKTVQELLDIRAQNRQILHDTKTELFVEMDLVSDRRNQDYSIVEKPVKEPGSLITTRIIHSLSFQEIPSQEYGLTAKLYANNVIAEQFRDKLIENYFPNEVKVDGNKIFILKDKTEDFFNLWNDDGFKEFVKENYPQNYLSSLREFREFNTSNSYLHLSEDVTEIKIILENFPKLLNSENINDHTPLHFSKSPEKTALLLEYGANINALNRWGATPLHTSENIEVSKLLIKAGADINKTDNLGNTPLHYLHNGIIDQYDDWSNFRNFQQNSNQDEQQRILANEILLAKTLIDAGADTNIKNNKGETALVLELPEIEQYLKLKGINKDNISHAIQPSLEVMGLQLSLDTCKSSNSSNDLGYLVVKSKESQIKFPLSNDSFTGRNLWTIEKAIKGECTPSSSFWATVKNEINAFSKSIDNNIDKDKNINNASLHVNKLEMKR